MIGERNIAVLKENDLECKWPVSAPGHLVHVLEVDILPLHDQLVPVVQVSDLGVVGAAGVEVGHEGGDVLRGGEPGVDIVPSVEEAPSGDGDVGQQVAIERELEADFDGVGLPVALGQHAVLLDLAHVVPRQVEAVKIEKIVLALFYFVRIVFGLRLGGCGSDCRGGRSGSGGSGGNLHRHAECFLKKNSLILIPYFKMAFKESTASSFLAAKTQLFKS